jgi:hypothetical protein
VDNYFFKLVRSLLEGQLRKKLQPPSRHVWYLAIVHLYWEMHPCNTIAWGLHPLQFKFLPYRTSLYANWWMLEPSEPLCL